MILADPKPKVSKVLSREPEVSRVLSRDPKPEVSRVSSRKPEVSRVLSRDPKPEVSRVLSREPEVSKVLSRASIARQAPSGLRKWIYRPRRAISGKS